MALIVDQQSNFKHFCKICKKGFMCGRALGGHMRAHGIGDESGQIDDEEPVSDWEDKHAESVPPENKRMYALRTNPNRCKSTRSCENCGKEFASWKSFLEHGKCVAEDVESLVSSHDSDDDDGQGHRGGGWSKRKRTVRINVDNVNAVCPSSEEEDLANCLMMLSNSNVPIEPSNVEPEESCASASKDEDRRKPINFMSPIVYQAVGPNNNNNFEKSKGVSRGLFECKACKKVFNSHQALGGHRASHKKVKGCFAAKQDQVDEYVPDHDVITHDEFFPTPKSASNNQHTYEHGTSYSSPSTSKRKSKVHECSICHRVFSSGQALGGHKRCHWITSNSPDTASLAKLQQFHDHLEQIQQIRSPHNKLHIDSDPLALKLDLNIPGSSQYGLARAHCDTMINPTNLQTGFEFSTEIYLKSWLGIDAKEREVQNHQHDKQCQQIHSNKEHSINKKNVDNPNIKSIYLDKNNEIYNVEDEGNSKVKLAKLSELKDMNRAGSSSSWLQVGIGSTTTTDHHSHATTTIL